MNDSFRQGLGDMWFFVKIIVGCTLIMHSVVGWFNIIIAIMGFGLLFSIGLELGQQKEKGRSKVKIVEVSKV